MCHIPMLLLIVVVLIIVIEMLSLRHTHSEALKIIFQKNSPVQSVLAIQAIAQISE